MSSDFAAARHRLVLTDCGLKAAVRLAGGWCEFSVEGILLGYLVVQRPAREGNPDAAVPAFETLEAPR